MKLKIKVKVLTEGCMPEIRENGDWIDLMSAENITISAPQSGVLKRSTNQRNVELGVQYIPLGVAIKLPEGFEAIIAPRSSSANKFGFIQSNSIGIVDATYCGNDDQWKLPVTSIRATNILQGNRICQFRIQLSQKATFWQKLKWLFSNGVELVEVQNLEDNNRGGFGSSGV